MRTDKKPHMREDQFQEKILELCKYLRLKVFHIYDSRKSAGPGFPDLVITGPKGTIFAELKSTSGKVSADQQEWLTALDESGEWAVVWRPEDWTDIQNILMGLAR